MAKGLFITFEGVEGSGKSLQAQKLREFLINKGYKVVLTREPGGTPSGERIRDILLDKKSRISPWCELFLYLADRANNIEYIIKPNLEKGFFVISDRYFDSTIAYQGAGRRIPVEILIDLRNIGPFSLLPDITILLDLPVEIGLSRLKTMDRLERETVEFHKRIREMYLKLAEMEPERFFVVDASLSVDEIHGKIIRRIMDMLKLKEE